MEPIRYPLLWRGHNILQSPLLPRGPTADRGDRGGRRGATIAGEESGDALLGRHLERGKERGKGEKEKRKRKKGGKIEGAGAR